MTRDYKPAPQKTNARKGSPFFSGLLIGLLLGIGASLALTVFIKGGDSPFENKDINAPKTEALIAKTPQEKNSEENALPQDESPEGGKQTNDFDFYTILPETESTVTEQEIKENTATVKKESYFLQVGAFQNVADADNMKAKLALQGFEALVQTATIPDKGVWHRVRVGPLSDIEQINKIRGDLTTNGFNTDLIKVRTETPPQ
ncbi:MAG: SPOR domain-containing protein [Methylophilaceae bacterium]